MTETLATAIREKATRLAESLVDEIREFTNLNDLRRILAQVYYEGVQDGIENSRTIYREAA